MLQFYKPNSKNTGSACSFSYNKQDKALYVSFVRQASWNSQTKTGSFKGSGLDKKASSKVSSTELAGLVHSLEANTEYNAFHGNTDKNTTFKLAPYSKDGSQVGYSFALNQRDNPNNVKKSFIIGFNFAEGRMLKEYILASLRSYFEDNINDWNQKEQKKKVENNAPSQDNTPNASPKDDISDMPW